MKRLIYAAFSVVGAAVAAYYSQPAVKDNTDLILIIITVLTVFAGFLIAIISIIGDPIMIPEGSWRTSELGRDRMDDRLFWHIVLFSLYLLAIGLLFVGVVLEKTLPIESLWRVWIERSYLFLGILSFLLTFLLPSSLREMQRARYDAETERRRNAVGIRDDQTSSS
jgi:MFS family permease